MSVSRLLLLLAMIVAVAGPLNADDFYSDGLSDIAAPVTQVSVTFPKGSNVKARVLLSTIGGVRAVDMVESGSAFGAVVEIAPGESGHYFIQAVSTEGTVSLKGPFLAQTEPSVEVENVSEIREELSILSARAEQLQVSINELHRSADIESERSLLKKTIDAYRQKLHSEGIDEAMIRQEVKEYENLL